MVPFSISHEQIIKIAIAAFGSPNIEKSTEVDLRFGAKGSKSISLEKGVGYDFERFETITLESMVQIAGLAKSSFEAAKYLSNLAQQNPNHSIRIENSEKKPSEDSWRPIWEASINWCGSFIEKYLGRRGILYAVPKGFDDIRFHPNCPYFHGVRPCMVALIRDLQTGEPIGIQRTPIANDGTRQENRLNLGKFAGGGILFANRQKITSTDVIGVGEGIETTLSIFRIADYEAIPLISLVNAGNMGNFKPPPNIKKLIVAVDNDEGGINNAKKLIDYAREKGISVTKIMHPIAKKDLNDFVIEAGDTEIDFFPKPLLTEGLIIEDIPSNPTPKKKAISATVLKFIDITAIPSRDWIYGHFLMRGVVSGIVASGGVGKSSLTITMALALASGKELLHDKPYGKMKIWLWNGEDSDEELQRRIGAACKFHNISEADISGRIFLDSGLDQEIIIAKSERGKSAVLEDELIQNLKNTILQNDIDCVIIDPFISIHRVEENDNGAIDLVVKTWARIANECGCSILLVHHTGKMGNNNLTAESARGASSFINALRSALVLIPMTKDQASKFGLENKAQFVCIEDAKANFAPRDANGKWIKLESVALGNGRNPEGGDFVGVVSRWDLVEPIEEISSIEFKGCKELISQGNYKYDFRANDWVGKIIAEVLDFDITNGTQKKKVRTIIDSWIKSGELLKVSKMDAQQRRNKDFVEVSRIASVSAFEY